MPSSGQDNFAHSKAIINDVDQRSGRIRRLNDRLRQTLIGGSVNITQGVEALGLMAVSTILYGVRQFDEFSAANDPYDEHDFGALTSAGQRILWKIDYYDLPLESGSPNPADPDVTTRVITIMLASEY